MPTSDERGEDEEHQPGDLVIEVHRGTPMIYTEPDGGDTDVRKKSKTIQDKSSRAKASGADA